MKVIIWFTLSLFAATALAAPHQYKIETQIFIDGKIVSSPKVITLENKAAEMTQVSENPYKQLKMKVIASENSANKIKDGISMKFDIDYITEGKTIQSSPHILVQSGKEAIITVGDKNGTRIELKVTATREESQQNSVNH